LYLLILTSIIAECGHSRTGYISKYERGEGNSFNDFIKYITISTVDTFTSVHEIKKDDKKITYKVSNTSFGNDINNNFATSDGIIIVSIKNNIWFFHPE